MPGEIFPSLWIPASKTVNGYYDTGYIQGIEYIYLCSTLSYLSNSYGVAISFSFHTQNNYSVFKYHLPSLIAMDLVPTLSLCVTRVETVKDDACSDCYDDHNDWKET